MNYLSLHQFPPFTKISPFPYLPFTLLVQFGSYHHLSTKPASSNVNSKLLLAASEEYWLSTAYFKSSLHATVDHSPFWEIPSLDFHAICLFCLSYNLLAILSQTPLCQHTPNSNSACAVATQALSCNPTVKTLITKQISTYLYLQLRLPSTILKPSANNLWCIHTLNQAYLKPNLSFSL